MYSSHKAVSVYISINYKIYLEEQIWTSSRVEGEQLHWCHPAVIDYMSLDEQSGINASKTIYLNPGSMLSTKL